MDKNQITQNQYTFIILSAMIAVGVLSMASGLCKTAKQNAWIPVLIGGLYPLYILLTASIIDNKSGHDSYWEMSYKVYGKVFTYIFSIIFLFYFLTVFTSAVSGFADVLVLSITNFLQHKYIVLYTLIFITFISISGLQMLGRVCEFYFYITVPLLLITFFLFPQKECFVNVRPVYFSLDEMLKSIPITFFSYSGCEISFFIIDKISNKKGTKKTPFMIAFLLVVIYAINVFMIVCNLGWTLTSKLNYPLLYLIQTIEIPILSNFLSIVILLWSLLILKCLLTFSYTTSHIFSMITKINYKKSNFVVFLMVFIFSFFMFPSFDTKGFLDVLMPIFVSFSAIWGIVTTILVSVKYRSYKK